jgi:hypothetical protein
VKALSILLAAGLCAAAQSPQIFYSKKFPGSTPAYVQITIEKDGSSVYMEDPKDEQPLKFQLTENETAAIFGLAEKLDNFKHPLESGLKVANMGIKTFRYQNGAEKNEQSFNYSTDENARALSDWFERIVESERLLIELERTVRFDRIGVNQAVMDLAVSYERKRLIAPEQFLPMLDRIAKNDTFVHMARERAASLADAFRAQKPRSE